MVMVIRAAVVVLALLLGGCGGPQAGSLAAAEPTPAGRLVGFVYADTDGDGLQDVDEAMLSGVAVTVRSGDAVLVAETDGNGWFGFSVADGEWAVSAACGAWQCADQDVMVAGGGKVVVWLAGSAAATATVTPIATATMTPPAVASDLALQVCPDATPACVQVWLGLGAAARWWPVCPSGRPPVDRFCLNAAGAWYSLQ